jgi:hypothetical protein
MKGFRIWVCVQQDVWLGCFASFAAERTGAQLYRLAAPVSLSTAAGEQAVCVVSLHDVVAVQAALYHKPAGRSVCPLALVYT